MWVPGGGGELASGQTARPSGRKTVCHLPHLLHHLLHHLHRRRDRMAVREIACTFGTSRRIASFNIVQLGHAHRFTTSTVVWRRSIARAVGKLTRPAAKARARPGAANSCHQRAACFAEAPLKTRIFAAIIINPACRTGSANLPTSARASRHSLTG